MARIFCAPFWSCLTIFSSCLKASSIILALSTPFLVRFSQKLLRMCDYGQMPAVVYTFFCFAHSFSDSSVSSIVSAMNRTLLELDLSAKARFSVGILNSANLHPTSKKGNCGWSCMVSWGSLCKTIVYGPSSCACTWSLVSNKPLLTLSSALFRLMPVKSIDRYSNRIFSIK